MQNEPSILLSALSNCVYCERRFALKHAFLFWQDNVHTATGSLQHERVHEEGQNRRDKTRLANAIDLFSVVHGMHGKSDRIERLPDGTFVPVEYKKGRSRAHLPEEVQLCAQAMCLEEMHGVTIERGYIYHHSSRKRREVIFGAVLRDKVLGTLQTAREILQSGRLPPPANDARCRGCSFIEICEPAIFSVPFNNDYVFCSGEDA